MKTVPDHLDQITVGLVQINNSFSNQNYFPYSVGILQAYAEKHLKNRNRYSFQLPVYCRIPVQEAVEKLKDLQIVLFSTYVWNIRISLEIAKRVKKLNPEIINVFGGPQVPNQARDFLAANPFVDIACHNEGEQVILAILEKGIFGAWPEVPSISFLDDNRQLIQNPVCDRIKDLSSIPSPYLEGTFEPLMEAYPHEHWIALWETNRGCPFSCAFCDWGSAVQNKVYTFEMDRIRHELEWFANHRIEYIFCADANFGILPRDLDVVHAAAETKAKRGYPHALSVQNTKNATDRAYLVQKTLAEAGLNKGVTISFQSMDKQTLANVQRANISLDSFQELQRRFTRDRIETYSDMILALPGETYDTFADGTSAIIENGQHNRIQFNNLSILPNAEMGNADYRAKYGMEVVESKIVNIHGSLVEDEIFESQELCIATHTMPREDWVKTRAFCWTCALLHFDKIFQIPLVLLNEICSVRYRELIEIFSEGPLEGFPVLSEIRTFFRDKARDIQRGDAEYCQSKEWLNIWWPADEYIFIKLSVENKWNAFYNEASRAVDSFLKKNFLALPAALLHEAILLNQSLLKQPFQKADLKLPLHFNILEFYQSAIMGVKVPLVEKECVYQINRTSVKWSAWEDWFREVVWYGNKKGAYLYTNRDSEPEIAGHY